MKQDLTIRTYDIEKKFAQLYTDLRTHIERYVYFLTGGIENAEDVRQEIFIKLFLQWEKMEEWDEQQIRRYVFILVRNLLINQYRHQVVRRKYQRQAAHLGSGYYHDDSILVKEAMKIFYRAIGKLPRRQKEVFELKDKELRPEEIAYVLNISEHTVNNSACIAFKKVKGELKKELGIRIKEDGKKKVWSVAA